MTDSRSAVLLIDSFAGRCEYPVLVVGETPKRYRIRAHERPVVLGGCGRVLAVGKETLVPRAVVKVLPVLL